MLDHYMITLASQRREIVQDLDYIFDDYDRMSMVARSIDRRSSDVKRCPTKSSATFPRTSTTGFPASRVKSQLAERGHVPRIHAPHVKDSIIADICAICSAMSESRFTGISI